MLLSATCNTQKISGQHSLGVTFFWGARGDSPWGLVNFAKKLTNKLLVPIFNNCGAHFSVGKIINWVGNFGQWTSLIYWVGKIIH